MTYQELACIKHALLDASVLLNIHAKHLSGWVAINDEALKIVTLEMLRMKSNVST